MTRRREANRSRWVRNRARAAAGRLERRYGLGDDPPADETGGLGAALLITAPFILFASLMALGAKHSGARR